MPDLDWVDLLAVYAGIGLLTAVIVPLVHYISTRNQADSSIQDILAEMNRRDDERHGRRWKIFFSDFLEKVVVPVIAVLFIILVWPLPVWWKIKEIWFPAPAQIPDEDKVFRVAADDLVARVDVADVEAKAMINDPLGAVPSLPFGHLNGAWKRLLDQLMPGDELWQFSAEWEEWSRKERRSGYVIVREGVPGDFWVTRKAEIS